MRLVRYEKDGNIRVGVKEGSSIIPTDYTSMLALIREAELGTFEIKRGSQQHEALENVRLLSPIDSPGKILCSGINYVNHKEENPNAKFPEKPSFFSKLPSSIIGQDADIVIPFKDSQVDYEVELTLIIGKTARKVSRRHALDYVFGYTVMNDVSERKLQFALQHETIGKGFDTFCPLGPELVLTDEIPDPSKLWVSSYVNGELRQSSSTAEMLFDIPYLIEYLSENITLHPGDVISTGTPAGVGVFHNPPTYLRAGDVVEVKVDKIGTLRNRVTHQ